MSKRFDIVCFGSATRDVFVRTRLSQILTLRDAITENRLLCFDYGGKVNVDKVLFLTGGGATNTAVSFARLGLKSAFLGATGADRSGQDVIEVLETEGVSTKFHIVREDAETGYSVVLNSFEGDRSVLVYRGVNSLLSEADIDWSFAGETDWLYITSLSGKTAQLLPTAVERATAEGVKIAINPGSAQLAAGLTKLAPVLAKCEILILNRDEAAKLTARKATLHFIDQERCTLCRTCDEVCPQHLFKVVEDRMRIENEERCLRCGECMRNCPTGAIVMEPWAFNIDEIFEALLATGVNVIAITDGARGVQAADADSRYLFPPFGADTIDTLGAGDAFGSAFVATCIKTGGDIAAALTAGSANGASVVQRYGAKEGLLTEETLAKFIRTHSRKEHHLREMRKQDKKG